MITAEKDDAIFEKVYEYFSANDNFVKYGGLVNYVSHFFTKDDVVEWIDSCPYIFTMGRPSETFDQDTMLTSEWIV